MSDGLEVECFILIRSNPRDSRDKAAYGCDLEGLVVRLQVVKKYLWDGGIASTFAPTTATVSKRLQWRIAS